ncbi:MAG: ThiF family adenylyltransferase [Gammaproteobacteria bacterium]
MSMSIPQAVSRPLSVAQGLVKRPIDETIVYSKIAVLTGEAAFLATANGRWCFLNALSLLSRVVGHLTVALPQDAESLRPEVEAYCTQAWSHGAITVVGDALPELLNGAHAILNVGMESRAALPWTSINSNGWVARVSSGLALPSDIDQPNPLAALMAASLGVTEVFKRIFEVPNEVAPLFERTEFSLWDLTTAPAALGPPLPHRLRFADTLLAGAGAIGNAIALLLAQLRIEGRLHIIDRQRYGDENMGTCLLMDTSDWLNQPKAVRLTAWVKEHSTLTVTGEEISIEAAIAENRVGGLAVDLILNGFDDVDARREAQRLWPSVIVDGGISEVGAAVVQYRVDRPDSACLMCWFEAAKHDEKTLQSRWTGLSSDSLRDSNRQLSDQDIAVADESKRQWLRERQREGKTVCSIITEAQLATRLGIAANKGFRPSVPFVASASAALVVAAAIKAQAFPEAPTPSMFQIGSLFLGPDHSASVERVPLRHCQCVTRRTSIHALCTKRASRKLTQART